MRTRWLYLILVSLLLLLIFFLPARGRAAGAEPEAAATVLAASGTLRSRGPAVAVPVQVVNVQRLGAATVVILYDPALVKPTACQRSALFDVGLCNTSYDSNGDGKPDAVLFNAVSLNGVTAGATPVSLVSISWQSPPPNTPPVQGTTTVTLGVQVRTFTDVDANPLDHIEQAGQLTITTAWPRLFLPMLRRQR